MGPRLVVRHRCVPGSIIGLLFKDDIVYHLKMEELRQQTNRNWARLRRWSWDDEAVRNYGRQQTNRRLGQFAGGEEPDRWGQLRLQVHYGE